MPPSTPPETPLLRENFYGRRIGRALRPLQQEAHARFGPAYLLTPTTEGGYLAPDLPAKPVALGQWLQGYQDLWLEIGFGAGEHLLHQAGLHPDIAFIGCEPFLNGAVRCLRDAGMANCQNLRILADDARPLLRALPDQSVGRLFILFPDPWPKRRHWERRLFNPENIALFARILRKGGILTFASDHADYRLWVLHHLLCGAGRGLFHWDNASPDQWSHPPEPRPATRYEQKALAGIAHYFTFSRS